MPIATLNKIPYPQALNTAFAVCTAAKTTENDLTNAVLLYTSPTNGSIITKLTAIPRGTGSASFSATRCKVYVCKSSASTVPYPIAYRLIPAQSITESTAFFHMDFGASEAAPIKLAPGDLVYVAIGVAYANGVAFCAEIEEFG